MEIENPAAKMIVEVAKTPELMDKMAEQVKALNCRIIDDNVSKVYSVYCIWFKWTVFKVFCAFIFYLKC